MSDHFNTIAHGDLIRCLSRGMPTDVHSDSHAIAAAVADQSRWACERCRRDVAAAATLRVLAAWVLYACCCSLW